MGVAQDTLQPPPRGDDYLRVPFTDGETKAWRPQVTCLWSPSCKHTVTLPLHAMIPHGPNSVLLHRFCAYPPPFFLSSPGPGYRLFLRATGDHGRSPRTLLRQLEGRGWILLEGTQGFPACPSSPGTRTQGPLLSLGPVTAPSQVRDIETKPRGTCHKEGGLLLSHGFEILSSNPTRAASALGPLPPLSPSPVLKGQPALKAPELDAYLCLDIQSGNI